MFFPEKPSSIASASMQIHLNDENIQLAEIIEFYLLIGFMKKTAMPSKNQHFQLFIFPPNGMYNSIVIRLLTLLLLKFMLCQK
jgi:hypothetical protein